MKKFIQIVSLSLLFGFFTSTIFAQNCSDLFFSEYVEGTNNNKALEIYNPTDSPVDLSDYRVIRWSNGGSIFNDLYAIDLAGTIESQDVHVIVLDKQDCSLAGQDTCVFEALLNKADAFYSPVYQENRTLYHNGNDAISLNKISDTSQPFGGFVDIFGQIGIGGTIDNLDMLAWNDVEVNPNPLFPPFTSYVYEESDTWWTRDRTLIRKATVQNGTNTNPNGFNASVQWDSLSVNTFDQLGTHDCDCNSVSIDNLKDTHFKLFPNPANDFVSISADESVATINIMNLKGQVVKELAYDDNLLNRELDLTNLQSGAYLVKLTFQNGAVALKKLIKD